MATSLRPGSSRRTASPLREEVRAGAEDRPGVYRWLGTGGRILYVGKSVRLRTRLLSYFRQETGKTARMVAEAEAVRWDYLPNEFAALFREMRLIRAWQPEYNVQHKRDRRYGFVKVTREPAPRLIPVSRPVNDGARYYGPFSRTGWMSRAVHELSLATGLRDCASGTPVHFGDQIEMFPGGPHAPLHPRGDGNLPRAVRRAVHGGGVRPAGGGGPRLPGGAQPAAAEGALRGGAAGGGAARLRVRGASAGAHDHAGEPLGPPLRLPRGGRAAEPGVPGVGLRREDRVYLIRRGRLHGELPWPKSDGARRRANGVVADAFRPVPADREFSLEGAAAAEVLLTVTWFNRKPKERKRAVPPERWLRRG